MAGKGRPLTNRSNYWHQNGLAILEAAATRVLCLYDPLRTGYVDKEELVCEGWWRSFRYATDAKLELQYLHAITHMKIAYRRLRYEQLGKACRPDVTQLTEDMDFICPHSARGFELIDIIDEVAALATPEPEKEG